MNNLISPRFSAVDILKALANGEFTYYYQPIISLVSGNICGAEALLRWVKPDGQVIMPAHFIPLAERVGVITEITREMYPKLIDDLSVIHASDDQVVISLNLSAKDLESEHLPNAIRSALIHKGLPLNILRVELVESIFMPPQPVVRDAIFEIANQGIPIVLNDFSAGYTSLKYLSQLPLTAIKLSMEIVQRAPQTKMDFRIVRHLVNMGHQLGLEIIAEGVEDEEIYNLILSTGCASAQGFYFSHALPLPEFLGLLTKQPCWVDYPFGLEYLAQLDHIDLRRDVMRAALMIRTHPDGDIRKRAIARLPGLDISDCLLGEWYADHQQEWRDLPGFSQLGESHRQFHQTAAALLQAALAGEPWDHLEKLMGSFSDQSGEIMQCLQGIEKIGLVNHYNPQ